MNDRHPLAAYRGAHGKTELAIVRVATLVTAACTLSEAPEALNLGMNEQANALADILPMIRNELSAVQKVHEAEEVEVLAALAIEFSPT